jgi:hypothetical protein
MAVNEAFVILHKYFEEIEGTVPEVHRIPLIAPAVGFGMAYHPPVPTGVGTIPDLHAVTPYR